MKNMFNVTTVLSHNLLQTNPCIRHNFSTQFFRKRAAQLHYVGPELRYIFWPPCATPVHSTAQNSISKCAVLVLLQNFCYLLMPYYLCADLKSKLHTATIFVIEDLRKYNIYNIQLFRISFQELCSCSNNTTFRGPMPQVSVFFLIIYTFTKH